MLRKRVSQHTSTLIGRYVSSDLGRSLSDVAWDLHREHHRYVQGTTDNISWLVRAA